MAGNFAVNVNPAVLRWARETARYSVADVALRFRTAEPEVQAWESGKVRPTWSRLGKLAKVYRRPVAALLIPQSPKKDAAPTDFRACLCNAFGVLIVGLPAVFPGCAEAATVGS